MVGGDGKPTSSFGLVNRMFPHLTPGGNIKAAFPPPPTLGSSSGRSSGESGDAASGSRTPSVNLSADPSAFAYRLHESDSASSLGSLADKVAEFVEPERVPEKIPHKATGEQNTKNAAVLFSLERSFFFSRLVNYACDPSPSLPPLPRVHIVLSPPYARASPFESIPHPCYRENHRSRVSPPHTHPQSVCAVLWRK